MSKASSRRNKLAELRALRASGKKAYDSYEVAEEQSLYEEVDENQYKKIVRDRLNQDDFVVDDNGEGYADDGREEWDRVPQYDSESEDDIGTAPRDRKSDKRKRDEDKAKRDANDRDISEYFMKGHTAQQPKTKVIKTEEDETFLANLLGEVDTNIPAPASRASKRHRSPERRRPRALSPIRENRQPATKKARLSQGGLPPTPQHENIVQDDDFVTMDDDLPPLPNDEVMSDPAPLPSSPISKAVARKSQVKAEPADEEEDEEMMEVAHAGAINTASVNLSASRPIKKLVKPDPYPSPASSSPQKAPEVDVDASSWNDLTDKLNTVGSSCPQTRSVGKLDYKDAIEDDGSLNMFWTDYTELNGSLCLFGKVLNKKNGSYVSCFAKVDNIFRKLYFLPRKFRHQNGRDTSEEVGMMDVYSEVDAIMTKMGVKLHKIKKCTRKYAFELSEIPREADYLKLLYPYTNKQIDLESTKGETFSHIFGTNTALFEQFVLWKNIMGPCWLKIKDADFGSLKNSSYAKLEVLVDSPDSLSPLSDSDNMDAPPLTLMSLAMRTTFNAKDNKAEILSISARIYESVSLSDTTPADQIPSRTFTVIRPNGASFPFGFDKLAQGRKNGLIKLMKHEADILSFFLAQLDLVDPDVILGHQLEGVDYSILLNRLHEKKTPQWSRLGRLRRAQWPTSIGKAGGSVFAERQLMSGRLLCDIANDAGKSVMFKCQSWSLTEMCNIYLGGDTRRRDVDNDVALKSWANEKNGLMDYITHMEADTYFIAALALQTQMLSLTKVLTNLAGNSWARTLTGTRAERNEYILLHEFTRNKYICPDKEFFKGRAKASEGQEDDASDGKKKDKYQGGLVFEPEKGLYDKFVLVMDFNSLYPSIIQEFNICFTTVERADLENENAVPDVPKEQDQGILPRLIATLVSRRRQVKSLMKDKSATPEQLATWDIKQLALKLTANSMYGCLGYTKSRFYARPLAVLTTSKGREILQSTRELAESKSLQVIYGDTDSVMINANVESVADAFKVGGEFKKAVNERYRLLEIDIDNVFRRILLQAKKKYAAINLVEVPGGKFIEKMEVKGLDMKRREYCALSKEISTRILNEILSGDETEVSIQRIHEYLREISSKIREHAIPTQKYIIYTQLGKAPKEYPNADSMPQVQVALREIARGKNIRRGDVISYVVTGDSGSSDPVAKRAYTPQDVTKKDSELKVDVEWYLGKQIFPPVERLCANISGTSTTQLAEQLGLDIRRYANNSSAHSGSQDLEIHPLESQIPDEIRFAGCSRLSLRCRKCKTISPFEGLFPATPKNTDGEDAPAKPISVTAQGSSCPSCSSIIPNISIVAQVEHAIRIQTSRYYEGWLVCDDPSCGNRTRQLSVYGTRCLGPKGLATGCLGRMRYEFSEREIYNQLVYYASLWDVEKARIKAQSGATGLGGEGNAGSLSAEEQERVRVLATQNETRFGTVKAVVDRYLDKCGRQWVAMDTLFSKLGFAAI
ncbi:hypothetical protein F5Y16DRAFT_361147 [Xylariaceae sp. FL0255]|nr:hypothetical protein F5Y16DRAFT_361147 [Xylariaceae sp. FL0255]